MFSHTLITALEQLCPLSHDSCLNFFERVTLMHELYRVLSAISADTFSQHFRTYFIIPCNPMIYKHLKLLRRPEWNTDIRTVLARQGLNIQKKRHPSDDSFFYLFESTRRRRTSGGRSTATTAAERRHSDRSNPAGLEHTKKEISNGYLLFCIIESTRRDSNPRPSPWQGDTPPLSHSCTHTFKTTY